MPVPERSARCQSVGVVPAGPRWLSSHLAISLVGIWKRNEETSNMASVAAAAGSKTTRHSKETKELNAFTVIEIERRIDVHQKMWCSACSMFRDMRVFGEKEKLGHPKNRVCLLCPMAECANRDEPPSSRDDNADAPAVERLYMAKLLGVELKGVSESDRAEVEGWLSDPTTRKELFVCADAADPAGILDLEKKHPKLKLHVPIYSTITAYCQENGINHRALAEQERVAKKHDESFRKTTNTYEQVYSCCIERCL